MSTRRSDLTLLLFVVALVLAVGLAVFDFAGPALEVEVLGDSVVRESTEP